MATALYRLGRTAYRRWPVFMLAWLLAIAGIAGFAKAESKPMSESFTIPGLPSIEAAETQKELFPNAVSADKQVTGQVVVQAPAGHTLAEQPYKGQVDALVASLAKMPQLSRTSQLANPAVAGPMVEKQVVAAAQKQGTPTAVATTNARYLSPLSADKRTGVISWTFDAENPQDVDEDTKTYVTDAVEKAHSDNLVAVAGGTGMQQTEMGGSSEAIGIVFALVILVITFGSLVAAGLPIIGAIVGVVLGSLCITASTAFFDISSSTPTLSSMIGLAVGIDYALFILSRYRSELTRTKDREHAIGIAIGTAGSAVVFAGLTVVVALTALWLSGISILGAMGIAAAGTVTLAVLVALTLLPAILGALKGKAFAGRVRRQKEIAEDDHEFVNGSVRLGRGIRVAPIAVTLLATALLGGLAAPVGDLHLGLPSDATAAVGTDARTGADLLAAGWGPGKNAPMIAVVDNRGITDAKKRAAALGAVTQWAAKDSGVANAQVVQATQDLKGAVVMITPRTGPADRATDDLLTRLHDSKDATQDATGAKIGITGITAIQADFSDRLASALPVYLGTVVVLAFLILTLVFRSLVVPAIATLGFLLSVLATLGVMVKLVQDGLFGFFDPQPIMSLMPTLLIGIVFGLAMDYQVFLTTRMREAYVHGMNPADAIIDGFRHSGRVVTAAALIMISVFAAFAAQDNALIKSIGVGLATAVFLDAFVVRMVLLPAVMNLLGRHAWWMPRWLDKITPHVDVEGAGLQREGHAPATSAASTETADVADVAGVAGATEAPAATGATSAAALASSATAAGTAPVVADGHGRHERPAGTPAPAPASAAPAGGLPHEAPERVTGMLRGSVVDPTTGLPAGEVSGSFVGTYVDPSTGAVNGTFTGRLVRRDAD